MSLYTQHYKSNVIS